MVKLVPDIRVPIMLPGDEVLAALVSNKGEKFVDGDVTPDLREAGLEYLRDYENGLVQCRSPFHGYRFLESLKGQICGSKGLSTGQIRGVLNVMRLEIKYHGKKE
jgi:hypothetical protein